jgi:ribose-phosphate pyrophosphokinase
VTDTIPPSDAVAACSKVRSLSVADMLAETIYRIHNEESVSSLFD